MALEGAEEISCAPVFGVRTSGAEGACMLATPKRCVGGEVELVIVVAERSTLVLFAFLDRKKRKQVARMSLCRI